MKLHIGGKVAKEGWTLLNAQSGPHVDIVGDFKNLDAFDKGSVEEIYASHVLEHLSYSEDVLPTLTACHDILVPGGRLMLAVPNMEVICRLMIHPETDIQMQFHLTRIIFGGQVDSWDYHKAGFTPMLLAGFLGQAGFEDVQQVDTFGLFDDTSELKIGDIPVSLNVIAVKA